MSAEIHQETARNLLAELLSRDLDFGRLVTSSDLPPGIDWPTYMWVRTIYQRLRRYVAVAGPLESFESDKGR